MSDIKKQKKQREIAEKIIENKVTPSEQFGAEYDVRGRSENDWPKWKNYRLESFETIEKFTENASDQLNKVRDVLYSGIDILDSIQTFINILRTFELLFKNSLYYFINQILDQLQQAINDLRSSGVYVLDLISYHLVPHKLRKEIDWDDPEAIATLAGNAWYGEKKTDKELEKIKREVTKDRKAKEPNLVDKKLERYKKTGEAIAEDWHDAMNSDEFLEALAEVGLHYKKESYNEFIDVICGAILNTDDKPAPALIEWYDVYKREADEDEKISGGGKLTEKFKTHVNNFTRAENFNFLKSGRPNFGPQAHMEATLWAFGIPNFFDLVSLIIELKDIFPTFLDSGVVGLYKRMANSKYWSQRFKFGINNNENVYAIDLGLLRLSASKNFMRDRSGVVENTTEPYFVGITLNTLFGDFFDALEDLINWLRSLSYEVNDSIFQVIEEFIQAIREDIERILYIIDVIEKFIRLLNLILKLIGFHVLKVKTEEGPEDLARKIRNAYGFRRQTETNKEQDDLYLSLDIKKRKAEEIMLEINSTKGQINKFKYKLLNENHFFGFKPNATEEEGIYESIADYENFTEAQTYWIIPENITEDIWKLYINLWKYENELERLETEQVEIWEDIREINEQLSDFEPHVHELKKQAEKQQEITEKENEKIIYELKLSNYNVICNSPSESNQSHLKQIKDAVIEWEKWANGDPEVVGDVGQDLNNKLNLQEQYSQSTQEELDLQEQIDDYTENGFDINGDGQIEYSIESLRDFKEGLDEENDRFNNGWDPDNDGIFDIIPIDDQIQDIQDQIDIIDTQQADDDSPDVLDYDDTREALLEEKERLEDLKITTNTSYSFREQRLSDALDYLDGLETSEYQTALDLAKDNPDWEINGKPKGLVQLKEDRDESNIGSDAWQYRQDINELENELEEAYDNLIIVNDRVFRLQQLLYEKKFDILDTYGIDIELYPIAGGLPLENYSMDDPIWERINIEIHNAIADSDDNAANISVTAEMPHIGGRPNIPREYAFLFYEDNDGIWYYQRLLHNAQKLKWQYEEDINRLPTEIQDLEDEYDIWKEDNVIAQEDQGYVIFALEIQLEIIDLQNQLNSLISTRTVNYNDITDEINNIYDSGWTQFLNFQDNWYLEDLTSEQFSDEWANNETYWLKRFKEWDKRKPDVTRNANEIIVKKIDDAIGFFTPHKEKAEQDVESLTNKIASLIKEENGVIDEETGKLIKPGRIQKQLGYINQTTGEQELVGEIQERIERNILDEWTPDLQMYYGGILFIMGWPNRSLDPDEKDSYFNFSTYTKEFLNDPETGIKSISKQTIDDLEDTGDDIYEETEKIKKIFDRWF